MGRDHRDSAQTFRVKKCENVPALLFPLSPPPPPPPLGPAARRGLELRERVPPGCGQLRAGRGGLGEGGRGAAGHAGRSRPRGLRAAVLPGPPLQPGAAGAARPRRRGGDAHLRPVRLRLPEPVRVPVREPGRVQDLHQFGGVPDLPAGTR